MLLQLTLLHTYCNVLNNTSTSVCVVVVHDIDTGMLLQLTLLHTYCNVLNNTSTSACVVDVHDIDTGMVLQLTLLHNIRCHCELTVVKLARICCCNAVL